MKRVKNILISAVILSVSVIMTSCSTIEGILDNGEVIEDIKDENTEVQNNQTENTEEVSTVIPDEELDKFIPAINSKDELPQFSEMQEGETIAIISTSMGDITIRFFEDLTPKATKNFLTLASEGYYDGIIFHRVINDFMIQGGDPTGTGKGGESIYGGKFEDEISPYLRHFSGAVAYANSGPDSNGSQFYIVENDELDENQKQYLENFKENPKAIAEVDSYTGTEILNERYFSPTVADEYLENGGTYFLDFNYTIFAHVIDGMDVVHNIAEMETANGTNGTQEDKPIEDVIINNITITSYTKSN